MKKRILMVGVIGMVLALTNCASNPEQAVTDGKIFDGIVLDHVDSSIPIEEHSYVVILGPRTTTDFSRIAMINGEKATRGFGAAGSLNTSITSWDVLILPPGTHSFTLFWEGSTSWLEPTITFYTAEGKITAELLPGNYYFVSTQVDANKKYLEYSLQNLKSVSEALVFTRNPVVYENVMIPTSSIVAGINAKIATKFKGFEGGKGN